MVKASLGNDRDLLPVLKHLRAPKREQMGGNRKNWMTPQAKPYTVKIVPISLGFKPKPPEKWKGRWVLSSLGTWRG